MERMENNITIGKNTYIEDEKTFTDVKNKSNITIGDNVKIYGYTKFHVGMNGKISIGNNSIIAGAILISNKEITIGNNVVISYYVSIMDSDFHSINPKIRKKEAYEMAPPTNHDFIREDIVEAKVIIEDNVKIGANCIILKGVTIGEGSEIFAGTVVTKNIPKNSYVEGNPAKIYESRQK